MQRLERALRTRLFERTSRAVVLTADGERLLTRIEPIIRSLHAVIEEFCTEADQRERSVVVAATPMLATLLGLVAEGLGLTMLPTFVMRVGSTIDDTRFESATIEGVSLAREYGIASLPGRQWPPGARSFAVNGPRDLNHLPTWLRARTLAGSAKKPVARSATMASSPRSPNGP